MFQVLFIIQKSYVMPNERKSIIWSTKETVKHSLSVNFMTISGQQLPFSQSVSIENATKSASNFRKFEVSDHC